MEGLIPMVYKAIKKTKIRRQYSYLSSETAQSYNIADFYTNNQSQVYMLPNSTERVGGFHTEGSSHRRHKSVGDYAVGFTSTGENKRMEFAPPAPKQLVRFRSLRMLSCVTGA
ncbi:hypothetical protein FCV25MIE_28270 [Fagus crenata]